MGGSAFTVGDTPLYTPRMPKDIYETVKEQCQRKLQDLYFYVASPIDGPGKEDFGDVDIVLAFPKTPAASDGEELEIISKALNAEHVIMTKNNGCAANLAIAWPSHLGDENIPQNLNNVDQGGQKESTKKYIQVDVRVCPAVAQFDWMLFKHAHGDLWNIVGSMIRHYGLTVDDSALWLRVPEIEDANRKRARVFLSSEPLEILHFLGLPIDNYWDRPFDNLQQMFEYAARCRLMYVSPTEKEPAIKSLKSNDRRRMSYRPAFKTWVDEFMPQCREQGRFAEKRTTREEVTQEAFARFHVEREFTIRRDEFLLERQREYIWNQSIKGSIPEPKHPDHSAILYRSCLVKAMKRIILEGDKTYGVVPADSLKDAEGNFFMEKVDEFILNNQQEVGEAAIKRHHSAVTERMRIKQEKSKSG
ncbi:hypothetical protein PT974_02017 [Cladobotryum mycophilum]|uniref:Polymerase nucleotidyl transferase domain-containing protein n=1 Tax=Cladobotryum mycophilum TaxID=491253 RepID=A0ABR0SXQ4_9HYPO